MKTENPHAGNAGAGKNETQTSISYPAGTAYVKPASPALICGQCALFHEKSHMRRRGFCRYLGEVVWAETRCIVDPLTPEFLDWLDAEEQRAAGGVVC